MSFALSSVTRGSPPPRWTSVICGLSFNSFLILLQSVFFPDKLFPMQHCLHLSWHVEDDLISRYLVYTLEKINVQDNKRNTECLQCPYFKYCMGDCECMNIVCAFPKNTFKAVSDYLKEEQSRKEMNDLGL